jgi:hypothetical protein
MRKKIKARAEDKPAEEPKEEPKADGGDDGNADDMEAHEALRADAEACHAAAADAYAKAKGTDSAAALMAAEDAGDAAYDAHSKAKASSMKLRGAEESDPDSKPAPGAPPPAPAAARALASLAGPAASTQLELAQLAAFGRTAIAKLGAKSIAGAELKLDAAVGALRDIAKVRAAEKLRGHHDRLAAAVHAGMDRSKAFEIDAKGNPTKPLATWLKLDLEELDEVLTLQGFAPGAPAARSTLIVASPDGGDEAGLAARAEAAGVDIATRRAAEANVRRSQQQENAR